MGVGIGGGECFQFVVRVVRGKWFMVFASLLIMTGAGTTYVYGMYSVVVKKSLGYDDNEINLVTFLKDLGAYVAIFSGLICEVIPVWLVLLIGSAMNFGGFFMVWCAVTHKIARPEPWQVGLYILIGNNAPNFTNTIAIVTCVKNFPESRGVVLGLMKGLVGLCAAIQTQLYKGIYENDLTGLIMVTTVLPAITSAGFMFTLRPIKAERQPNELRVFLNFFYITIVLALFLMVATLLEKYIVVTRIDHIISAIVVAILLLLPLAVVIKEESALWKIEKQQTDPATEVPGERPEASSANVSSTPQEEKPKGCSFFADIFNKPERGENHSILQAILSIDMLYIFLITTCGYGAGLTAYDHFGRLGIALAKKERLVSSLLSLISIWNYYGRVYSGFLSELLLIKWKVPRAIMGMVMLILQGIGLLLAAFPEIPGAFYVSSVTIGFALGAQVPVNLAMISELFGLKYYCTLLNCAQLITPLALYLMNANLTKILYNKETVKDLIAQGKDPSSIKDPVCVGSHCFRLSFSILAVISFVGALISLHFARRTLKFYQGDIYKRFRDERLNRGDTFKRFNGETYMKFAEGEKPPETEMGQPSVNGQQ
ncbi:hypothetical protein CJ030_MR1G007862 [Morella rubra]|uniref:Uncharacterized protein n=1 Tax=Morella rubra TaxID=262757 RepID=A0A6A1WPM6_9ROSI|nr:hypothetical protein CJ030_MR1G007862 [Morella rubra]